MAEKQHAQYIQWGDELRRIRSSAGLMQDQLANRVNVAASTISSLERATRKPKADLADALDAALSTGGTLRRLFEDLTNQRQVPDWFRNAVLLERQAIEIREYEPLFVPGLLQTAEYAYSMLLGRRNRHTRDELMQIARARAERLPALADKRPVMWFVVRETALATVVGSGRIMKDQLGHIAALIEEETIYLQVLRDAPITPGLTLPLRINTLNANQSVVYAEHALGGETFEKAEKVAEIMSLFGSLQASASSPEDSLAMIKKLEEEMDGNA
ncbi:helix-turn-helix transcriptional regulator [Streptomonospora sp. S1-112]|uniref:Helix-turn-helix transcriptional regulator n=1 Tax=Streptomonospora mangrovi TaxID=2883123 RepID=A0A9X3NPI4_9ACTN|nr:helix-turn-helix transcriptional regulator [Streptomonospora mangrovi]MDA0567499.1 helix-turn-helix transcriptional regulator [Streptomonospora mangrovi]